MTKRIILPEDSPTSQRPPRQGHRKSRKGCTRCKQRRVKCNEQAPCQNCHRRGEPCSLELSGDFELRQSQDASSVTRVSYWRRHCLPELLGLIANHKDSDGSSGSDPWSFLPRLQQRAGYTADSFREVISHREWGSDLCLMHNYAKFAHTMVDSEAGAFFWDQTVLDEAMKYPWLMHGLLSLSACNLCATKPEEDCKYTFLISHHQQLTLPGFREALGKRSAENCQAIFAIAAIYPILSLAEISRGKRQTDIDEEQVVDSLVQLLILSRGLWTALDPLWAHLTQPPMDKLGQGTSIGDYSRYSLPPSLDRQMRKLKEFSMESKAAKHAQDEYIGAIDRLEQVYIDIMFMDPAKRDETGVLLKWAVSSSQTFHGLLSDRDVVALVIMAHWVILLSSLDQWYVPDVSTQALKAILYALPQTETVDNVIRWPREQLAQGLPAFRGSRFGRMR